MAGEHAGNKMNIRLAIIAALMALPLSAMVGVADADAKDKKVKERPVAPELAKYRVTGKVQNCVSRSRIRRTEVLNDYTILFHMLGRGKVYKNELPYRCFSLGFYESFSYTLSTNLLCNVDIISVFDGHGFRGVSCGLGDFEELEEIEEGDEDATADPVSAKPEQDND